MLKFISFTPSQKLGRLQHHAVRRAKSALITLITRCIEVIERISTKPLDDHERRSYASATFYLTAAILEIDKTDSMFNKCHSTQH